jgi:hypothetical protein
MITGERSTPARSLGGSSIATRPFWHQNLAVYLTAHSVAWGLAHCRLQTRPSSRHILAPTTTSAQSLPPIPKLVLRFHPRRRHRAVTPCREDQRGKAQNDSTTRIPTKATARATATTLRPIRQGKTVHEEASRGGRHSLNGLRTQSKWVVHGGDTTPDLIFSHIRHHRALGFGFPAGVTWRVRNYNPRSQEKWSRERTLHAGQALRQRPLRSATRRPITRLDAHASHTTSFHTLMRSDAGMNHSYNTYGVYPAPVDDFFVAILSFFQPSDRQLLALQLQLWQFSAHASVSLVSVSGLEFSGALCILGIMSLMIPVDLNTIRVQI